ncbi:UNVERIFIED_CONTAM: hypothetical protein Slati_2497900 [Sesamum latifolium]|uniref:Uncharacterized protein n=1 Tax=Sesamum latifolium TaxID=2727402 RepID=A0AAW2WEK6_9LAMI
MAANNQQFGTRNDNPPKKVNEGVPNKSRLVGYALLRDISPMLAPPFMRNQPSMPMPSVDFSGNNGDMILFPIRITPGGGIIQI